MERKGRKGESGEENGKCEEAEMGRLRKRERVSRVVEK